MGIGIPAECQHARIRNNFYCEYLLEVKIVRGLVIVTCFATLILLMFQVYMGSRCIWKWRQGKGDKLGKQTDVLNTVEGGHTWTNVGNGKAGDSSNHTVRHS